MGCDKISIHCPKPDGTFCYYIFDNWKLIQQYDGKISLNPEKYFMVLNSWNIVKYSSLEALEEVELTKIFLDAL